MFSFGEKKLLKKIADYKATFETDAGKRVFHDLLEHCHISTPLAGKKIDPTELAFAEGERNVALYMMKIMAMDATEIQKHIKEEASRRKEVESEYFD